MTRETCLSVMPEGFVPLLLRFLNRSEIFQAEVLGMVEGWCKLQLWLALPNCSCIYVIIMVLGTEKKNE